MPRPCPDGPLKGSRLQLRSYLVERQNELNQSLLILLNARGAHYSRVDWVSPVKPSGFAEYRDADFLGRVGQDHLAEALLKFWPENGPCWDALAMLHNPVLPDNKGVILLEAKSHRLEMCGCCGATAAQSRRKIETALNSTQEWLDARPRTQWTSFLYQYVNRLAHLYFLRSVAEPKVDAWLVNVYFVGDPYRPTSQEQWADFLLEVKWALGLKHDPPYSLNLYLPAIM
jgi:hypothetical protein